jgi:lipopolysaccharide biosynthesis glycosyltransferase
MYDFCTITSINYIYQTVALINSLKNEKLNILCLDKYSINFFLKKNIKNVKIFSLDDLNSENNLDIIRKERSYLEFVFTIKPIFLYFIFKNINKKSKIIYLDSDIFFLKNIKYLKKDLRNYSIFLTEHNFSKCNKDKEKYGIYNAGFVAFNKDSNSYKALKWWKKSCIEKCALKVTNNHFVDQKYLDQFFKRFNRVSVINNRIFNVAPWNIDSLVDLSYDFKNLNIIFFHFQGLKLITNNIFKLGLSDYHIDSKTKVYLNKLYLDYCIRIKKIIKKNNISININVYQKFKLLIKGFLKNDLFFLK